MKYVLLVVVMLGTYSWGQAQSNKKKKKSETQQQIQAAPSSRDPGSSSNIFKGERKRVKSNSKNKYGGLEAKAIQDYQQLKKANAKKYRKIERIKDKPQYSDPSYFGHKRKPKKRPVGKRKLCKECGIVH
ncbi:MAG: hypothetical protein OER04_02185 [Cyclobacteriaceae bacterium]|nr:hypothetical protein [Cyclobacteriaceae bacterium]